MPDDPITLATLTQFHREVLLPDVERIVDKRIGDLERRLAVRFDDINRHFDSLQAQLRALEERLSG